MEDSSSIWLAISLSASTILLLLLLRRAKAKNGARGKKPPGPRGWPVIGNMLELGSMPHVSLYKLAHVYGPVIWLKLGSMDTVVIQSAKAAENMFKNHDLAFADRKVNEALTAFDFNKTSIAFGNYGTFWRVARKLCTVGLLGNTRISESAPIRKQCINQLIGWINDEVKSKPAGEVAEVEVGNFFLRLWFNLIGQLMLSTEVVDMRSEDGHGFFEDMIEFSKLGVKPNVADYVPFLKWFDPQGIKRDCDAVMRRCFSVVDKLVKERVAQQSSGTDHKAKGDLLELLLAYQGDNDNEKELISEHISMIILEMFFNGDGLSNILEWAMAELIHNPSLMKKVREELDRVVGPTRDHVEESDMDKLPYLEAVAKETLRCHATIPLFPRSVREDTTYMGYHIPKDTQVVVNAWAIARDPEAWENPFSFTPERFLESKFDFKGKHYELLTFGSGRRMCAGASWTQRTFPIILANLLHYYDWELNSNIRPENLNMEEIYGFMFRRVEPLKVVPKRRFK